MGDAGWTFTLIPPGLFIFRELTPIRINYQGISGVERLKTPDAGI